MTKNTNILFVIILVGVIVYFVFIKKGSVNVAGLFGTPVNIDYNSTDGKIFNRFFNQISNIIDKYSLDIDSAMPLSVIKKESFLAFESKQNSAVSGDGGNSIGYMQASRPAVIDVNRYYGTTFTWNDLFDENNNLEIGCLYLNLCFVTAQKNGSQNPVWLSFKKYNGGNDETDNSHNIPATAYANTAYEYYKSFIKMV